MTEKQLYEKITEEAESKGWKLGADLSNFVIEYNNMAINKDSNLKLHYRLGMPKVQKNEDGVSWDLICSLLFWPPSPHPLLTKHRG